MLVVISPFTFMELIKINRFTPASAACFARFNVPAVLTLRNADNGLDAVSCMICARAAR
ncbi:hypothetical protein BMETH_1267_1 [methanotrophic bacterial endosymbiont of Bathymodiolus sp.]|nr:hypothetical protein BMETH_1267_1 [methanotrophic bacterial endosymbiont of Bathymodiolus sp.]